MRVQAIKTKKIVAGGGDITQVLDESLPSTIGGKTVIAITSKIVAICEGRAIPQTKISKDELIKEESEFYLPSSQSRFGHHFTIARNIIVASAGADESNGDGNFVLWPENPQGSANQIRKYLKSKYKKDVGVILTDSVVRMLRRGTTGIALAYSGFMPLRNYIGQPDLFGRPFEVTWANIADGLAGAAVLVMGEGAEQTPIAVIDELDFVKFQSRDPSAEELADLQISRQDDLFAPFLDKMDWRTGKRRF